jgi:CBS domain containing-hemolysin-like protein
MAPVVSPKDRDPAACLENIILDHLSGRQRGLSPARFVPETMTALKVFEFFKKGGANFLFVMDEYGGFAGILWKKSPVRSRRSRRTKIP